MRIAVFHNLPSGGAKRALFEQVSRLVPRHTFDLYTLTTANQEYADIRPYMGKVSILPFRPGRLFRSPLGRLNQGVRILELLRLQRVDRSLAEQINRGGYDLAFVHQDMFTFSPMLLKWLKIPSLYYRQDPVRWLHDPHIARPFEHSSSFRQALNRTDPLYQGYYKMLAYQDRTSMLAARRVVTNSYFTRESLYRVYGVSPAVNYLGVDHTLFRPLGLPREPFVMSVGAISPTKGYDFIIQGLARMVEKERPRLVLVGNASLSDELTYLQTLATRVGVQVEFHHLIQDEDLVSLYNRTQCVIFTPVMEPFGLVPLEAMACGTPVVGICEGGVRETIVNDQTGYLVDREPQKLADAVQHFTKAPNLVAQMGAAARKHIERHWLWEHSIHCLEKHIL